MHIAAEPETKCECAIDIDSHGLKLAPRVTHLLRYWRENLPQWEKPFQPPPTAQQRYCLWAAAPLNHRLALARKLIETTIQHSHHCDSDATRTPTHDVAQQPHVPNTFTQFVGTHRTHDQCWLRFFVLNVRGLNGKTMKKKKKTGRSNDSDTKW